MRAPEIREGDLDREPALGHRMGDDTGLVSSDDGSDDGWSEPVAALVVPTQMWIGGHSFRVVGILKAALLVKGAYNGLLLG